MNVDEAMLHWAAGQIRGHLYRPPQNPEGIHEGLRTEHYQSCPDLQIRVENVRESWYSEWTYEGWKVDVWVTCPHGEVVTNHGVTPLTPVMRTLTLGSLSAEILHDLDALQGNSHPRHTSS